MSSLAKWLCHDYTFWACLPVPGMGAHMVVTFLSKWISWNTTNYVIKAADSLWLKQWNKDQEMCCKQVPKGAFGIQYFTCPKRKLLPTVKGN